MRTTFTCSHTCCVHNTLPTPPQGHYIHRIVPRTESLAQRTLACTTMHIEWIWDTNRAPDPMHVADFFIAALVVLAVLFFLGSQLLVLLRRNTVSVRARRWWSLELMILGSIIHIIAEFVSNSHMGHMTWFDSVRTFHCTFWDYWFKYGLGFNLWQVGQAGRMFAWFVTLEMKTAAVPALVQSALRVMGPDGESDLAIVGDAESGDGSGASGGGATTQLISTKETSATRNAAVQSFSFNSGSLDGDVQSNNSKPYVPRTCECSLIRTACATVYNALYKRRFGILVFVVCTTFGAPGLLLCGAVELTHSIEYSEVYHWCVTHSEFVYMTVAWLLACVTVLMMLLLRMRKYNARESTSYRATRDSTCIGVLFLVVLVVANRFEVSVTWWGRSLQTSLVVALYVFSYMRLNWGMFRDAAVFGIDKENPVAHESTLSDIECVLSGEDKEPTFSNIMRTVKSRRQFIQLLQQLPLWELPVTFSSAMDPEQLTVQFAARCRARFKSDGTMYVEKAGVRRMRLEESNVHSTHFSIDDDGDSNDHLISLHHQRDYHFPSGDGQLQHGGLALMMEMPEEFKQVSLHEQSLSATNAQISNTIRDAQNKTVEVCPADVWLLYVAYMNYRYLASEQRTDEAIDALREILTTHFRLSEPGVDRILVNDPASVSREFATSQYNSQPDSTNNTLPAPTAPANATRFGPAGFAAAMATGTLYTPPATGGSTSSLTPVSLATIATSSIAVDDSVAYERTQPNESGTSVLLLDRKCRSTTRIFAQFFQVNRPSHSQNNAALVATEDSTEVLVHGGIHTLPLVNSHLRDAYVAAAQCNEDLDMHDPLASVGWMCEFLLGDVWLAWCIHSVPNFYRMYKAERRTMATLVAMDDGIASRPQRVSVTVV